MAGRNRGDRYELKRSFRSPPEASNPDRSVEPSFGLAPNADDQERSQGRPLRRALIPMRNQDSVSRRVLDRSDNQDFF